MQSLNKSIVSQTELRESSPDSLTPRTKFIYETFPKN